MARRSAETREQIASALEDLQSNPGGAPCSAGNLERMRLVAAVKDYLGGLGYVKGDTMLCSSLTGGGVPVPLGLPSEVRPSGFRSWDQKALPGIPRQKFNLIGEPGQENVAITVPELIVDVPLAVKGMSLVQMTADGRLKRARGPYSETWLTRTLAGQESFVDSGKLVVARFEKSSGLVMFAAMSVNEVHRFAWQAFWRYLPVALAVAALLLVMIWTVARELLSLRFQIKAALRDREFFLQYQPVMDLSAGRCVGAEALIRWKRRDGSMVSPLVFIPVAEQHGLIEQVTAQVMEMVATDAAQLIRDHPEMHIAINFSPDDLHSKEIEDRLQRLIHDVGASNNIVIEATERGLLFPEKVTETLVSVRAKGFRVGIDDFGTGNSSLSYLGTYDLDFLKIDKMFVDALGKNEPTSQVAFHIIGLAHSLGLKIVAEGVETKEQRDILREAGVQYAQGWIFAKPMLMHDLAAFTRLQNA
ncbi:MAG: EAL domain-containing protein [Acidobacteriaceae bacterium]|nr:EAL domain-containing protein [Acidobacteriaceae bacterium]